MRRVFVDPDAPSVTPTPRRRSGFGPARRRHATDTLYGLAVDPFRADAVARLFLS